MTLKIHTNKSIIIKFTWFILTAILFATLFIYFLGWKFEINSFLILLLIVISEIIIVWLISFVLIKSSKTYYLIDYQSIKLIKNDKILFEINKVDITDAKYMRFFWNFLSFSGGFLHISYYSENSDRKFSSMGPDGKQIHSMPISLKQAKEVTNKLGKILLIQ